MTSLPYRRLLPERAIESLDEYVAGTGGQALAKALTITREQIIAESRNRASAGGAAGDSRPE